MSYWLRDMLWVDDSYRSLFARLGLTSLAALRARFAVGQVGPTATVEVHPHEITLPDDSRLSAFAKHYTYTSPSWRFVGRPSKALCEYRNYAIFKSLGVPCADRIACGEWRDRLGRLRGALIVTRAIPEARTLVDFWKTRCPSRASTSARHLRGSLRRQLAVMTRRIHDAGFFHHDLVWRNVLVTWQPPAEPQLWWIDCPRGYFRRWPLGRRRAQLKDLASLDKHAVRHASRGERLVFVREYLGRSRLEPEAKRLIRDTLAYRRSRWPDD